MPENSSQRPPYQLMEYLYLLPAILALSPLVVAYRHTQELTDQEDVIFIFRILSLAWLWMMISIILYAWRPTIRHRYPFVLNVTKASFLGCLGVAPIALPSLALSNVYRIDVSLYTSLELICAWSVLVVAAMINAWFLKLSVMSRQPVLPLGIWEILSMLMLSTLAVLLVLLV